MWGTRGHGNRGYPSLVGPAMPTERAAASTVLTNNMALVMGPTPPMRGDSQPATSATSSATSETTLRPAIVTPAATTAPAEPAATTATAATPASSEIPS